MAHDVFISHASRDKPVADAVCVALENSAIRCWIAPRDVQPGRSFAGEINRAIQHSKVMALIFSAHSNNSEQVLREVQLAVNSHLHIIQFRIEDVRLNDDLEYFLSTPHWLDALTPPLENHIARLETALRALLGTPVEPSVMVAVATETQTAATMPQWFGSASSLSEKRDVPANLPQKRRVMPPPIPSTRRQEVSTAGKALRPPVKRGRGFALAGAIIALLAAVVFGGWWFGVERPREKAERELTEQSEKLQRDTGATRERPYENSLGMKFVPVKGTGVLFSIWETRVNDYRAFAEATRRDWLGPNSQQTAEHPAVNVSWEDATAFCGWLTMEERKARRISADQSYRLPSDLEWSVAVGVKKESESKSIDDDSVYPWGTTWPPPYGAGNYAPNLRVDDYEQTSPVGSFAANVNGIYDLGGNVWEWCEDDYGPAARVQRGSSWNDDGPISLHSRFQEFRAATDRFSNFGFRVVLAGSAPAR